jgi:hypothetical protein
MEVYLLPLVVLFLPDSRLFKRHRLRATIPDALNQSHVTHHCHITQHPNMRLRHRRVPRPRATTQLEVELVEGHPMYQVPTRLRLETTERAVGKLNVSSPVLGCYRIQQLLIQLQYQIILMSGSCHVSPEDDAGENHKNSVS